MPTRKKREVIRGEKHHWWPKSLSKYWHNENGRVNRIDYSGKLITSNAKEFGHISNGHNLIFDKKSPWDSTIEHYFDKPDGNMSNVIKDLLKFREWNEFESRYIYAFQEEDSESLDMLRECIISLIIRSPLYRNSLSNLVSGLRGDIDNSESKRLIPSNINQIYLSLIKNSKKCGRLVVLFSDEVEFIYGDGVYNNISTTSNYLSNLRIVIPLTPNIAIIWANPNAYKSNPKVRAIAINDETASLINDTTQIYSKDYLFYRNEAPNLLNSFTMREHQIYKNKNNPIYKLINSLIEDLDT